VNWRKSKAGGKPGRVDEKINPNHFLLIQQKQFFGVSSESTEGQCLPFGLGKKCLDGQGTEKKEKSACSLDDENVLSFCQQLTSGFQLARKVPRSLQLISSGKELTPFLEKYLHVEQEEADNQKNASQKPKIQKRKE
jgi:hypothetical protein